MAYNYQDGIRRMIIENLRSMGAITISELSIWLRDKYVEGFIDLDATLVELVKKDIIKQATVKGIASELIFLTNGIFMTRIPPEKLSRDSSNRGLPTQFVKTYREDIRKFFQDYRPTTEDNQKVVEILTNPQVYETIRLLRTAIVTPKDIDKLKKRGVDDSQGALKILWDNQMVKIYRDDKENEYYALLTDFYIDLIFPKYILQVIKKAYEQKSITNQVLIEYLKILEDTYYSLKSNKEL